MNPAETHEITELIGRLRSDAGYTILVIEHDMHVVEGISDRVVALDHGVKIAEGSFDAVATDPQVVEAYLGRARNRGRGVTAVRPGDERTHGSVPTAAATPEPPLLRLDGVDTYYGEIHILQGLTLEVGRRRARLPARRQRVGQVDDAEDGARHRPPAQRRRPVRRART